MCRLPFLQHPSRYHRFVNHHRRLYELLPQFSGHLSKACRIRVAMGVWWRRLNRGRGLLLQRYEKFYGGLQSMTACALSSAMSSADGVPGEPSVHGSTSLWYSLTSSAHRTPRYAQLHYGMVGTLKNRKRPHGRLPLYLWRADTETRHLFMAQRAVLMRAPLLSAVQTPHPISS